jgi:uncharacterized protein with ParB-like and HNH nuclease domain
MDANTRQLLTIFDPNVSFQVPLFQRPYVWKEKKNWEPLWVDIQTMLDKQLRNAKTRPHFMGAVVLEQIPQPSGSIEMRLVIDGQQRFTTLQIFLIAARNISEARAAKKYAARFSGLTENAEDRVESPHEAYKLWPTNSDRPAFQLIHECHSLPAFEKAMKSRPELSDSRLAGAYRYFHIQLAEWLEGKQDDLDDAHVLAGKTLEDRLETLWTVVKSGLQLVVIDLDAKDDTQVIFETLNARGTELLPADLIKNYLFRRAAAEAAEREVEVEPEIQRLFDRHWKGFESEWWREEVTQGRVYRPRIDLFINHYLTLMTRDEVKTTHLFNAFKEFVEHGHQPEGSVIPYPTTAAAHLEQLARYSEFFKKFFEPGEHQALALFLRRLDAVDTATVYPFLLYAYSELMPDGQAEFDRVIGVIEAFLMRRLITNHTPKNYNRLFVDLVRALEKAGDVTAATVSAQLAKGAGDSTKFPSNEDLMVAIFEQPLYGRIAQKKVRAVLEALDAFNYSSKSEALALPKKLTIEHVMPQSWEAHWPLPSEVTGEPITKQKASTRRDAILHTLGNLTLITNRLNPALSNGAWAEKRPELLKFSRLNLTQYFHGPEAETWDEAAIRARSEYLFAQLVRIWPELKVVEEPAMA